jgi:hypothetical protein
LGKIIGFKYGFILHTSLWCYDTQNNDTKHYDTHHNDTRHKIIRTMTLSINDTWHNAYERYAKCHYAERHIFYGILNVVILSVMLPI